MGIRYPGLTPPPLTPPARKVAVSWATVHPLTWGLKRVLYLYQGSIGSIFYIGMAYDCSVKERFDAHVTEGMGQSAKAFCGSPTVTVHVGTITAPGSLVTENLVSNVEALLIRDTNPPGNQAVRPVQIDLDVTCSGSWPHPQSSFSNRILPKVPLFGGLL